MKIKNWSKFQHFKDRKPPWVKLYRDVLDDMEWYELDALASKVLVMCWLIASEDEGRLPNIKTLAFRLRLSEKQTLDAINKLSHWLEHDDINVISTCNQDDSLETETEIETETDKKKKSATIVACPDSVSQQTWNDWMLVRKDKKAKTLTQTGWNQFVKQVELSGWTLEKAISHCCLKQWVGFDASWVAQKTTHQDIIRQTTPTPVGYDSALRQIEADRKKAVPPPANIKAKIEEILNRKVQ